MIKNNTTDIHYGIMCYLIKVGDNYSCSEIKEIFSLSDNDFFTHINYLMDNYYIEYNTDYIMVVTEKGKKVLKETNNEDIIEMRII